METKNIIWGLSGLIIGGLIVSIVATTGNHSGMSGMSMDEMNIQLSNKKGDDFDKAFISGMIVHHEGAVAMAKLAPAQAKHEEVKQLARDIIAAQNMEIDMMRTWQKDWGYTSEPSSHGPMGH